MSELSRADLEKGKKRLPLVIQPVLESGTGGAGSGTPTLRALHKMGPREEQEDNLPL